MKSSHLKKLTAAILSSALVLASSTPAWAFYNTPESKKGICSSHVDMVYDIQQAWQLAQANPYVEAFLLSRLVDAPAELAQGYAFGLYNCDGVSETPTTRKLAWNTYQMCQ